MKKISRRWVVVGAVVSSIAGGLTGSSLLSACSTIDPTGSSAEPIAELNCAYRTISPPNGNTLDYYQNNCGFAEQDSQDASYGYTNCKNGYIWEVSQVDAGTQPDRKLLIEARPKTTPTDQTSCEDTYVQLYTYGLDTVNDIQYAGPNTSSGNGCAAYDNTHPNSCNGQWVDGGAFGYYCNYGATLSIDLDSFGDAGSLNGFRAIGNAYTGSESSPTLQDVELETTYADDPSPNCIHAPQRQ